MVCLWMSNSNETLNYFSSSCTEAMFRWLHYRTFVLCLLLSFCSSEYQQLYTQTNNLLYIPPSAWAEANVLQDTPCDTLTLLELHFHWNKQNRTINVHVSVFKLFTFCCDTFWKAQVHIENWWWELQSNTDKLTSQLNHFTTLVGSFNVSAPPLQRYFCIYSNKACVGGFSVTAT